MSKPLVLLTGATGYLGRHILDQLLEAGHPVRVLARSPKFDDMRKQFGDRVDVRLLTNLAEDDFTEVLKDAEAVIHTAAPLVRRESPESMVKSSREGSLNIIRQAIAAGVKRIVYTGSWVTCVNVNIENQATSDHVYTDKDWNPMTYEDTIRSPNPLLVYFGAKTLAEREVCKLADEHPDTDITILSPTYLFGPLASGISITKDLIPSFTTFKIFCENVLQNPGETRQLGEVQAPSPNTMDVRDCARAHILALTAPPSSQVGLKRIILSGQNFTWKQAVEHLQKVRPELTAAGRLQDASKAKIPKHMSTVDGTRAREVLGLDECIPWEKTVEDTVESYLTQVS